jgi:hypothetical protein
MNTLVSDVAVAVHPLPVPLVVKAILGERSQRCGPCPQVVVDSSRYRLFFGFANGIAALVAESLGHINVTDHTFPQQLDGFLNRLAATDLRPMLHNPAILASGFDHLTAFEDIVRGGLFYVHILAGLASPDGPQRMPMIGCRKGDHIDGLVIKNPAYVGKS